MLAVRTKKSLEQVDGFFGQLNSNTDLKPELYPPGKHWRPILSIIGHQTIA